MLTPERVYIEELLDLGEGMDADVARSLADLRRINRFLGGRRVVLDALDVLVADRSVDVVTASLFLHHFDDTNVVRLLADFARVARRAVIVNDLIRNLVPYWFARLTGPLLATSFLTRYDGPASVLRGFTTKEMAAHAERAGLKHAQVRRRFPYRLALVARIEDEGT